MEFSHSLALPKKRHDEIFSLKARELDHLRENLSADAAMR